MLLRKPRPTIEDPINGSPGNCAGTSARVFQESTDGLVAHQATEFAFVFVGSVLLVLGGFIAGMSATSGQFAPTLLPSIPGAGLLAGGLALFVYGTRGFRRQLIIDPHKRAISFGKVNSSGDCRVSTTLPLDEITSLYVIKVDTLMGDAQLVLRTRNHKSPYTLLAGPEATLRELHKEISDLVRPAGVSSSSNFGEIIQFIRLSAA